MIGSLRQSMAWLHTWAGLLFGWLLYAVFLTGALTVFAAELTRWMTPETLAARPADRAQALRAAQDWLTRHAPAGAQGWQIELPDARNPALRVAWQQPGDSGAALLDPASGQALAPRDTEGGEFLIEFHYSLHAGLPGILLVGLASLVMMVTLVSGLIVHRRLLADFFTFRPRASPGRSWLDAHNVLGVLPLPFHLMITCTALSTLLLTYLPAGIDSRYGGDPGEFVAQAFPAPATSTGDGQPAATLPLIDAVTRAEAHLGRHKAAMVLVRQPNRTDTVVDVLRAYDDRFMAFPDRVSLNGATGDVLQVSDQYRASLTLVRTLGGLHYGRYAQPLLRWMYFLLGAAGAAMIATGLLLYTVRRSERPSRFDRLAARMNIAMIAGPLYACAGYLLANRLYWPQSPGLHEREVAVFFALWGLSALHAALRPPARLWREQWLGLAALLLAIPVADAWTLAAAGSLPAATATVVYPAMWVACGLAAALCMRAARPPRKA
ncbi:PepSY domain-containing protein [Bordetella sp. BOR01]|uniref:PepSY-associated TM helix domain-containing protein n=1 Tax=Bordetella sp. BOR01 TaxID=2854779 RepID=UPI001C475335|nr:PepSY-associated TM helix domain-containing protein [Bordetella sp. BOR01]MBV7482734.1 PepSY domain-containing protein [Bordetella sp. BOR01]